MTNSLNLIYWDGKMEYEQEKKSLTKLYNELILKRTYLLSLFAMLKLGGFLYAV